MQLSLIVAVDKKRGIGKNKTLPWNIPQDMEYFKNTTTKTNNDKLTNVVVMGRNTWESIPDKFKPLKNRINVVISSNPNLKLPEGVILANSIENFKKQIKGVENVNKIFIIGGQRIYEQIINDEDLKTLYITEINDEYDCDTFFPEYKSRFKEIYKERHGEFDFVIYEKI